ncbi:MAG: FUSC family protein [Acidimicrobiales bacterium]
MGTTGPAWQGNSVVARVVLACAMSAIAPWAVQRNHFLAVLTFTPIVFVFLTLVGEAKHLLVPRIIDTALGAAIVLILDVMFWSTPASLRPNPATVQCATGPRSLSTRGAARRPNTAQHAPSRCASRCGECAKLLRYRAA